MENPFESGHIKNYILLYASVVVIMVLFFIASSFFNEIEDIQKKVFLSEVQEPSDINNTTEEVKQPSRFKLLEKAY